MKKNTAIPAIRFKGFTAPWEQCKLGDVGKARSGFGFPESAQGGTSGLPFFKVSDMNVRENEREMLIAKNYVTASQMAAHNWTPIEELPAIFFAKVGAAVMLNRKRLCRFPFLLDNNTMAFSLHSAKWDADFAKTCFETVNLTSLVQVGALPSYNSRDVEMMSIQLPTLLEQKAIGEFFSYFDRLITLHQRKSEQLLTIKKSMLEKMFPQKGSCYPEIRFKGFTAPWEQRELGNIFKYEQPQAYIVKNTKYNESFKIPVLTAGQSFILGYTDENFGVKNASSESPIIIFDDFTTASHFVDFSFKIKSSAMKLLTLNNPNDNVQCAYQILQNLSYTPITHSRHWISTFSKFKVLIPESHKEQNQIGALFSNLESLITLHQRKSFLMKQRRDFDANRDQTNRFVL